MFAGSQLCSGGVFSDQTSVWFISDETEAEPEAPLVERTDRNSRHVFVSKTVRMSRRSPVMLSRFGFTKHVTAQCRAVDEVQSAMGSVALTLQVIRPETCTPCGKRIRFGKIAMKCRNCRVVTHPECKQGVIISCSTGSATQQVHQVSGGKQTVFLLPVPAHRSAF